MFLFVILHHSSRLKTFRAEIAFERFLSAVFLLVSFPGRKRVKRLVTRAAGQRHDFSRCSFVLLLPLFPFPHHHFPPSMFISHFHVLLGLFFVQMAGLPLVHLQTILGQVFPLTNVALVFFQLFAFLLVSSLVLLPTFERPKTRVAKWAFEATIIVLAFSTYPVFYVPSQMILAVEFVWALGTFKRLLPSV